MGALKLKGMYVSGHTLSSHCRCWGLSSPHTTQALEQLFFSLHKASLEPFLRVTASYTIKDHKGVSGQTVSRTQTSPGTAESVVLRACGLSSGLQQTGQGKERVSQHSTHSPREEPFCPPLGYTEGPKPLLSPHPLPSSPSLPPSTLSLIHREQWQQPVGGYKLQSFVSFVMCFPATLCNAHNLLDGKGVNTLSVS